MDVHLILALCTIVWVTRGVVSDTCTEEFECNHSRPSSYWQCSNGHWNLMHCAAGTKWNQTKKECDYPGSPSDTACTFDPSSSTTSGTSTLTSTVALDTSTQCPNVNMGTMCPCRTPNPKYVNLTQAALEEILVELRKELTLKKTSLAMSIRRKISAKDSRVSSQLMGYTGAVMLATPILIIVLSDVVNLLRFLSVHKRQRNVSMFPL